MSLFYSLNRLAEFLDKNQLVSRQDVAGIYRARKCSILRVISLGCLSLLPLFGNAAEIGDPAATRQALDAVVERLNALTEWFDEAQEQRVRWLNDLKRKDTEVAKVAAEVELANQDLLAVNADLAALRTQPPFQCAWFSQSLG